MSLRRPVQPALIVLAAFVFAVPARADDWPVKRGPANDLEPYRYDAKAWASVPREFLDDYSACTLYSSTTHLIEADGTLETISHEITRLNGRKGIEALGEYRSISYDPTHQTLTLNEARILKADGTVVPIEPAHVQLRDVSTDYQTYDRDKQLVISFPNLEVGDCYEVKWTTRGKNPEFGGRFFSRVTFGDDQYPVVRDELRVRLPNDMPLHYATINGKVEHVVQEGPRRTHHWWTVNRKPPPQDGERPSKETQRLQLLLSTFASWDEVGQWKEKLRTECWKCTPEVRDQVAKLTRDLKTPLEKAQALTYWVRRSIRYVSISSAGKGYTPRLPGQVVASRYGDCKDQAQLLAVMMKEAGLDVSLVTLGILDDGQVVPEVPCPWGTHGIVLVKIDGKEHWIDTTAALAGWDMLPRSDRDRVVYVTQDGKIRLSKTPGLTYADNTMVQLTQMDVRADGTSVCRRAMTYSGLAALSRRDAWMEVPPGERRRLVTAELQDAHSRSRLVRFDIDDKALAKLDTPVTAGMEYQISGHFTGDLASREASITDSNVWNRLLAYNLDPERTTPLHLVTPFESVHRYVIQIPPAYRFDGLPKNHQAKSKWGSFEIRVVSDDKNPRRLEVTFHTRLEQPQIDPPDFAEFQRFHDAVSKHWRVWLAVKPTQDIADAPALEFMHALTHGADRDSASVLARVYQSVGRYADARRVLAQSLRLHPRDADLWELAVKSAADLAQEEAAYRELTLLFPDEPKHALALGATRVKRGNHIGARVVLVPLTVKGADPIRAQAHYQLALSAFAQKQFKSALEHLESAGLADADSVTTPAAFLFKARLLEAQGDRDAASAAYREAANHDGEADEALQALVRLERAAGHVPEALDALRRLTVRAGKDREALLRAGELYLQMNRLEDAFELANRARDLGFSSRTQRLLGLIHLKKHEYEKAVFHLDRADIDADVLNGLMVAHIARGNLSEAKRHAAAVDGLADRSLDLVATQLGLIGIEARRDRLLRQLRAAPGTASARAVEFFVCAHYVREFGTEAQAEKLLDEALKDDVPIGAAYTLRAEMRLSKGRLREALADAERATTLMPGSAKAFYVRGRVRFERGEYGALGDLLRAADLSERKDALILHWLAAAQFAVGQRLQALQTQRLAASLHPRDPVLLKQLEELERMLK
jgi:tetratricopeptide (TPR) repeat protein/transglutaminase-like putative cysteine protease